MAKKRSTAKAQSSADPDKEIVPVAMGEFLPKKPETKYKEEMCNVICGIADTGGHIAAMRDAIGGISKDTWYRWQELYPEFKEAVELAKLRSQVYYEKLGLMGATGQIDNFSATTYALIMNNKFKDEYSRGTGGGNHTEITYNNTLQLEPAQVTLQIAQKLEKLKNLGVDLLHDDGKNN